jgi:hypothetical protein
VNETSAYNSTIGQLIEPESIAYSFNTPGWYLIFGLLVLIALVIAILQYWKYRKNAYRREAVEQIKDFIQQKNENVVFELNELLKRMTIALYGRKKVASLYGLEWFNFLVSTTNKQSLVSTDSFNEFTKAHYKTSYELTETQRTELAEFAILWVENHRINV